MALLPIPALELKDFSYYKTERILHAEASTVNFTKTHQLYDDACDEGIAIRSHHTSRVERFFLSRVDRDAENDVLQWIFYPVDQKRVNVREVRIYND